MKQHDARDPECLKVFEQLSAYLDGELSPEDCQHIREHIQDCEPCIEFVESLKKSIEASHCLHCPEQPAPLAPETIARLQSAWQAALSRRR